MTTYTSAQKPFIQFCHNHSLVPLPVTEKSACLFIATLLKRVYALDQYLFKALDICRYPIEGIQQKDIRGLPLIRIEGHQAQSRYYLPIPTKTPNHCINYGTVASGVIEIQISETLTSACYCGQPVA